MATIATAQADMVANVGYEATGSVTMARALITACGEWVLLAPVASSEGGTSVSYDLNQVKMMRDEARAFVRANASPSGRVSFLSVMDDFR